MITSLKQREIKFKPRIKLNHNRYQYYKTTAGWFSFKWNRDCRDICTIFIEGNWYHKMPLANMNRFMFYQARKRKTRCSALTWV